MAVDRRGAGHLLRRQALSGLVQVDGFQGAGFD